MIDELDWVRSQRPTAHAPSPQARRRARHALQETISSAGPHRRRRFSARWLSPGNLAAATALLVVVAVVAVFLGTYTRRGAAPAAPNGPELVFRAEPSARAHGVASGAIGPAVALLKELIPGRVSVSATGDRVVVRLSHETPASRLSILSLAAVTGRLAFYDWEADTITPKGEPVAALLAKRDPTALAISQGGAASAPGSAGAGSLALYPAVRLADSQPASASAASSRGGAEYFAFGMAPSSACATAARDNGVPPTTAANAHCYLAGPASNVDELTALLPGNVPSAAAQMVAVPAGMTVLEAVPSNFSRPVSLADPSAQFYVLRDRPGILGTSITNPATGVDASGTPSVTFNFTSRGSTSFQRLTAQIARRGDLVSGLGETLDQHFAVALGNQLVTVPSVDFKTYPDGITPRGGAYITGGFTRRSSQRALLEVRLGSLPITLRLISSG